MTRIILALTALAFLAACGGGGSRGVSKFRGASAQPVYFATGPVYSACMAQNRKAASRTRCGCVQAVANQSLSTADQQRGTGYFRDPAKLQEVRQSDGRANERFWKAWKAFGQRAEGVCAAS